METSLCMYNVSQVDKVRDNSIHLSKQSLSHFGFICLRVSPTLSPHTCHTTRHSAHAAFFFLSVRSPRLLFLLLHFLNRHSKPYSPFIVQCTTFDALRMAVRRPDQIPPWQITADGYESPIETVGS
jgi:hypothetical protein